MRQKKSLVDRAIASTQEEIIRLVGERLGRGLTEEERAGIERIRSLMMLESIHQSFSADTTTPATIESDLGYFAARKD